MRWNHAPVSVLLAALAAAPASAAPPESVFFEPLRKSLDAAVEAEGGEAWTAAESEVREYPAPSSSLLTQEEHGRAIALVIKTIDALSSARRVTQGTLRQTMDAAHAAYHRSTGPAGQHGRDFKTFSARLKQLRVLYAVHDRHTLLAPRLAAALHSMLRGAADPGAWVLKLKAAWAGTPHADEQRLYVALLEGGPEPDTAGLVSATADVSLAPPVRGAALEALARQAPTEALARARTLLTASREAWHLTDAALRVVSAHGTAEDAAALGPLVDSAMGWLGVDARALRAKLGGGEPSVEVDVFGVPLGVGSVLFLVDGDPDMTPHRPSSAEAISKALAALPDAARIAVWVANRGIVRLIDEPIPLAPPNRQRIQRALETFGKGTAKDSVLPDFFLALDRLVYEQRESSEGPGIDTVVLVTTSVLYQDDDLQGRYTRWARRAGLRLHCVCFENGRTGFDEYRQLAESTGGRMVLRPKAGK